MNLNHRLRSASRQGEPASLMLESVLAAVLALSTLAAIAPMFERQMDLIRRARNTDLLEALVNKDISAFRHYATIWQAESGPFSRTILYEANMKPLRTTSTYSPSGCTAQRGFVEQGFRSDLGEYPTNIPGAPTLKDGTSSTKSFKDVPGYLLTRSVQVPGSQINANNTALTVRLNYTLTPLGNSPPLAFYRTADVQVEAQNWC